MREFTVIIEKDEDGWYVGSVVELAGCFTQARTIDELIERMKEAIEAYLNVEEKETSTEFVGVQKAKI